MAIDDSDPDRTVVWRRPAPGSVSDPPPLEAGRRVEPVQPDSPVVNVNQPANGPRYTTPYVAPSPMRVAVWRAQKVVYYIAGLIEALIAIRFILKVIAANPTNPFTVGVYNVSWIFDFPFSGIVPNVNVGGGSIIEVFSLIAIVVYILASLAVAKLLELLV